MGMTGYIEAAGLRLWREVSGEGDPLVLLHGGFAGASSFFAQVPALVEAGYRVHAPERRGQAHTPDVEGPLSYSVIADDMVAYLEQEVGGPAHLVGRSDGAVVAAGGPVPPGPGGPDGAHRPVLQLLRPGRRRRPGGIPQLAGGDLVPAPGLRPGLPGRP
jgi:Alpha/beta hydrolase family